MSLHSRARLAALTALPVLTVALGLPLLTQPAGAATSDVHINEVESNGDSAGDWVEILNTGTAAVDVSGWGIVDDDSSHSPVRIPSGTVLQPGGYRVVTVEPGFGLGAADEARLLTASGTVVDATSWSAHASTTWGRCPNGTGAFATTSAATKGAANRCPVPTQAWPGGSTVVTADGANVLGSDLSGLAFQGSGTLWAAQNSGRLWRLVPNGSGGWKPDTTSGWTSGKSVRFPGGSGAPDAEAVALTDAGASAGVFVGSERDGSSSTSRLSVLRYDVSGSTTSLTATREWNLTADLPSVSSNGGIEALTFVPDAALTAAGFRTGAGTAYDPAGYPAHFGGIFLVGIETGGAVHGYVLNEAGGFTRVTSFASGLAGVMDLEWEPALATLWAVCDDTCSGKAATFGITTGGSFTAKAVHDRPSGLPDYNDEGFAIAPQSECVSDRKPVVWADDGNDGGHALRTGTVSCSGR
ncbi:lamin tail domain-containing protein [Nocardioides sp. LML1-1-1.1]|uniref:lamin tail domain-containing protein n=1 Tax=Nocardioides sp. LML1-1-1.1 TaxID=3135248 RepID=UPI003413006D